MTNGHHAIEKETYLINKLLIFGPISKAVPRANVSFENCFWHKDKDVTMRSPDSWSLGNGPLAEPFQEGP